MRADLPWLTSGPLHRVHTSARAELDVFLGRHGYRQVHLDGRAMTSRPAAHAELARAFRFPEHYGRNWDAFDDSMWDVADAHRGELVAVVWEHLDAAAPATLVEVGHALLAQQTDVESALTAFDVFALGSGADFDRP